MTPSQRALFEQAAARWKSIIVGDLPDVTYQGRVIDDLLIEVRAAPVDGVGRVLGQSAPGGFRTGTWLPYYGTMEFDSADLAAMETDGSLAGVVMHEMGHVLGFGTLWQIKGLLAGAATRAPQFVGAQATAEYMRLTGRSETGVPLEANGGLGTRDVHWSETSFAEELMTPYAAPGAALPVSRMTAASLADLGYTVNIAAADPWLPARKRS